MIRICVIVPAYNEAARLPVLFADIQAYLRSPLPAQAGFAITFLIVDDGSRREEAEAVAEMLQDPELRGCVTMLRLERNRGKGGAIRAGFEQALGEFCDAVAFIDADSSVPISEMHRLLVYLTTAGRETGLGGVIASRVRMLGRTVTRSNLRHAVGRVFATFVATYYRLPVYDTQCGLKAFDAEAVRPFLDVPTDTRWVWDTQLLMAMLYAGERIHELPIDWRETGNSKVSLVRDPLRMFYRLVKFRRRLRALDAAGTLPRRADAARAGVMPAL